MPPAAVRSPSKRCRLLRAQAGAYLEELIFEAPISRWNALPSPLLVPLALAVGLLSSRYLVSQPLIEPIQIVIAHVLDQYVRVVRIGGVPSLVDLSRERVGIVLELQSAGKA